MRPVCAAQVHPAQAIYLFPLAFPKSASAQTAPQARRHLQLQPRRVLLQVRRGQWRVPRRRRVSVCVCARARGGGGGDGGCWPSRGSTRCSAPWPGPAGVGGLGRADPWLCSSPGTAGPGSFLFSEVAPMTRPGVCVSGGRGAFSYLQASVGRTVCLTEQTLHDSTRICFASHF